MQKLKNYLMNKKHGDEQEDGDIDGLDNEGEIEESAITFA